MISPARRCNARNSARRHRGDKTEAPSHTTSSNAPQDSSMHTEDCTSPEGTRLRYPRRPQQPGPQPQAHRRSPTRSLTPAHRHRARHGAQEEGTRRRGPATQRCNRRPARRIA
eukprot:11530898-Alexandrium_andersonii.AAC.1